jgi:hypothetical protein
MAAYDQINPLKARKKVRWIGTLVAVAAAAAAIWPLLVLEFSFGSGALASGSAGRLELGIATAQTALCSVLFIGALLFRSFKPAGRTIMLVCAWIAMVHCVVLTCVLLLYFVTHAPFIIAFLFSAGALIIGAFFCTVLCFPVRYLSTTAKAELDAVSQLENGAGLLA